MHKEPTTYFMMNQTLTTIYIGVTSDIEQRVLQHKSGVGSAFTSKYLCNLLVYSEQFQTMTDAIDREKQLKNWKREWKLNLIKTTNPDFIDIAKEWFDDEAIEGCRKSFGK